MNVAIIDSGIHAAHPHVERVAGGVNVTADGPADDYVDRLGHGTAVAGAIREKAPGADLYAVKVFDQRLSTSIDVILRALEWCIEHEMDVINLSLGTTNPAHREGFERILARGARVVSAAHLLPGLLPAVIGVAPDPDCARDQYRFQNGVFYTSPYPRSIPGVPIALNLHGASFAVANMTGFLARLLTDEPRATVRDALIARAVI